MQSYSTLKAVTTRATDSGLKPGTRYVFQVRARTSAGCGRFSQAMEVETGKPRECREGRARARGQGRGVGGKELVCAEPVRELIGLFIGEKKTEAQRRKVTDPG